MMSLTLEKLSKIRGNLGRNDRDITRYMGSGITAPGSEITSYGIRISVTVSGSRVRFSDITTKTPQF